MEIKLNGSLKSMPEGCTVSQLISIMQLEPKKVAVELNRMVIPAKNHDLTILKPDDEVEVVTLVGGGSNMEETFDKPWQLGPFSFKSRLITGTGKYSTLELMREALDASACEVTTVAVRRERLTDKTGRNILDFLDLKKLTILPNTAGCFSADDAIRHARLGRELLTNLENPGAQWIKLECLGDTKTLLPDPVETLRATEILVKDGFHVLAYTSDDPILARSLKKAGATCVMPAGSPIGSGQGILNPNNIRIILEYLKGDDADYPVVVDAGVGCASDVAFAMELGCDGVLLNTAIAQAKKPVTMAIAMKNACIAGRLSFLAGRISKKLYAQASSPMEGLIS
jgi:thiazole synthase